MFGGFDTRTEEIRLQSRCELKTDASQHCWNSSESLTCHLHADPEVDVGVGQVPLHQDVVPLLPGRHRGLQLAGVPLPAVQGAGVVHGRRARSYLQHHGTSVAALVPGAAVQQLNLHLRHVIGDEDSARSEKQQRSLGRRRLSRNVRVIRCLM